MPRVAAVGHLELLWHFSQQYAPAGDIGKWTDGDIEEACEWAGEPGDLVGALVAEGFLDACETHRLLVHDWPDHCPRFLSERVRRDTLTFAAGCECALCTQRVTVCPTAEQGVVLRVPTQPNPTQPNPTQPNRDGPTREELWGQVNDARGEYLPGATGLRLDARRGARLVAIRADYGKSAHTDAVHGYVAFHLSRSAQRRGDFDPMQYFVPETFWKASGVAKYLDADRAARDAGLQRPYSADQIESGSEARVRQILDASRHPGAFVEVKG